MKGSQISPLDPVNWATRRSPSWWHCVRSPHGSVHLEGREYRHTKISQSKAGGAPRFCICSPAVWAPPLTVNRLTVSPRGSSLMFCSYRKWKWSHSVVSDSLRPPWTVAYQAPLSMGFSRQEYWSGLPFPSPGDLPYPGIKPGSPALEADALPSEPQGSPFVPTESRIDKRLVLSFHFQLLHCILNGRESGSC